MTTQLSKTQIDRLGDRLRTGLRAETDLKILDDYRRSFGPAYESVVRTIRKRTQLKPTGRPAKSTGALIEKLHRESIRLTQVQDIAGCRVIVPSVIDQERVITLLRKIFPKALVVDRRKYPSFDYRAVHIIVQVSGSRVEIQVRSSLQHLWAELSEKLSDVVDPTIKYGGGPPEFRDLLAKGSAMIASVEQIEANTAKMEAQLAKAKRSDARFVKTLSKMAAKDLRELEQHPEYIRDRKYAVKTMRKMERDVAGERKSVNKEKKVAVKILNELISLAQQVRRKTE